MVVYDIDPQWRLEHGRPGNSEAWVLQAGKLVIRIRRETIASGHWTCSCPPLFYQITVQCLPGSEEELHAIQEIAWREVVRELRIAHHALMQMTQKPPHNST